MLVIYIQSTFNVDFVFQAYASGCDVVILASDFSTINVHFVYSRRMPQVVMW